MGCAIAIGPCTRIPVPYFYGTGRASQGHIESVLPVLFGLAE